MLEVKDLAPLPVHGPNGRIAAARRALALRQVDFADEIVAHGGRASRETVSHWENLDPDGTPRARMTRRNAAALASLLRDQLGAELPYELFFDPDETAWDRLSRQQLEFAKQIADLTRLVASLQQRLEENHEPLPQKKPPRRR